MKTEIKVALIGAAATILVTVITQCEFNTGGSPEPEPTPPDTTECENQRRLEADAWNRDYLEPTTLATVPVDSFDTIDFSHKFEKARNVAHESIQPHLDAWRVVVQAYPTIEAGSMDMDGYVEAAGNWMSPYVDGGGNMDSKVQDAIDAAAALPFAHDNTSERTTLVGNLKQDIVEAWKEWKVAYIAECSSN